MWRHLLISLVVLPLAAPAAGHATTVAFDFHPKTADNPKSSDWSRFTVTGDDDTNAEDLHLTWTGTGLGKTLDVVDPTRLVVVLAAPEATKTLCFAVDDHHVRCTAIGTAVLSVELRGGDDRFTLSGSGGASVSGGDGDDVIRTEDDQDRIDGGPGDDDIRTGDGQDLIDGGPGDDVLDAGAGGDLLTGGPGRDEQHGGPGNDSFYIYDALGDGETLDGGPGRNMLHVSDPGQPLQVNLAAGHVTSPRGVTELIGFHDASVFAQAPLVIGDDGPNKLHVGAGGRAEGRGGDDELWALGEDAVTLLGGDGDDLLLGERGAILNGGPGNDRFRDIAGLGGVRCGAGTDVIEMLSDTIRPADCEGAHTWVGFVGRAAPRSRVIAVGLDAFDGFAASDSVCGIRVQALTTGGRPVTAALRARRHGLTTLRLPLKVAKTPKVVRFRVRYASVCPRGGPPWVYQPKGNAVWPAVTLTR
jgi:Ca2+-binding RTX toxin-like protein